MEYHLKFNWTVSKARNTYGYNICTLYVNNIKKARCNGGGYDMQGTVLGNWIAREFEKELIKIAIPMNYRNGEDIQEYYGLSFHNPNFDPGKAVVSHAPAFGDNNDIGKTVEQLEKENKSLGLERYRAFHRASSKIPTKHHIIPLIDGACGLSSVEKILNGLGYTFQWANYKKGQAILKK